MLNLSGKTALVTGAAQGIGRAIAEKLAAAGADVVIADIQSDKGKAIAKALTGAHFIHADLETNEQPKKLVEEAIKATGQLDIIVNNARPRIDLSPFPDCMGDWDRAMNVMVKVPAQIIAEALPYLTEQGGGTVLNISSVAAFHVSNQPVTYHVAKAGVVQMTKKLAQELGPKGIRINALCPALVDLDDRPMGRHQDPLDKPVTQSAVPTGKATTAEEVANTALFLCSDASSSITGQAVVIDGGMTLGDQYDCARNAILTFQEQSDT